MYIVLAIIMFGVLIAVHELGHFTAAKALGVKVNEFAIGMGPAIFKKQKGETLYSLRCLPVGGFCAMEGEDEETDDPRCFTKQPGWKKFIILAAGSFMNFLLGFILILIVYSGADGFNAPVLTGFFDGCPYESEEGLQVGDEFYSIDGHRIYFTGNVSTYLNRGGTTYDIVVIRDGVKVHIDSFTMTLVKYEGYDNAMYGFTLGEVVGSTFGTYLEYSWYTAVDFVRDVWNALSDLVAGAVGIDQLSGPVGIVSMINDVGENSASVGIALENIAYFAAFIAINLAVMNMLPIPALDGGRIFFLIINGFSALIFRRRIPPKYEGYVHAVGLVLLLALMVFVMYNDIARLITG